MSVDASEAFNARRLDDYYGAFTPDVEYHGSGGLELRGVDALRSHYGNFLTAFPDLRILLQQVVVDAETGWIATLQVESGTHNGDFVTPAGVVPATGRPFSIVGTLFVRINKVGLVSEVFETGDRMAITEQLFG